MQSNRNNTNGPLGFKNGTPFNLTGDNNQYLLRTENLEPLVSLTNQLSAEIKKNHEKLSEVCHESDFAFHQFPKDLFYHRTIQVEGANVKKEVADPLISQLLDQKYNLNGSSESEEHSNIEEEVEEEEDLAKNEDILLNQIKSIDCLLNAKTKKNKELYNILKDYETAIFTELMPALLNHFKQESKDDHKSELGIEGTEITTNHSGSFSSFDNDLEAIFENKVKYQTDVYKSYLKRIENSSEVYEKLKRIIDQM
ncbi:uncharacterized protein KGF55_003672 [Candida pseudojiufengensis]|uniref:uncharacterized protein n=1 Tax=Candida pseudojiufengensis TaxID=497109 RepID=UPI00222461E3|nr:uncharacterized protein KGF55_003672 [Candida pseudojiufengensis]KAI5962596.1 hypothetical protein KGF55_003672 [Candida pseudojiufengensis]